MQFEASQQSAALLDLVELIVALAMVSGNGLDAAVRLSLNVIVRFLGAASATAACVAVGSASARARSCSVSAAASSDSGARCWLAPGMAGSGVTAVVLRKTLKLPFVHSMEPLPVAVCFDTKKKSFFIFMS